MSHKRSLKPTISRNHEESTRKINDQNAKSLRMATTVDLNRFFRSHFIFYLPIPRLHDEIPVSRSSGVTKTETDAGEAKKLTENKDIVDDLALKLKPAEA